MNSATFRCYWSDGVETLTVALASPVHLTRHQHQIAPGGLDQFESNSDQTLWIHDHRAAYAKYRIRPLSQSDAKYLVAAAAGMLQFCAYTGLRPAKRGGMQALEMDFRKTGLPLTFQSAWRHPETGRYYLLGEPFTSDLPPMVAQGFNVEDMGGEQYVVSRDKNKRLRPTDSRATDPLRTP